jgi:hypothetical protein
MFVLQIFSTSRAKLAARTLTANLGTEGIGRYVLTIRK